MEKHLFYYASHSQYSEPTDKPAVSYCEQEDEVHYHPDPFNGHEYVDLGLPSGTLWAKCNVGATSETDYGLYFAWGETEGYAASQIPSKKKFNWGDYNFGSRSPFSKYNNDGEETALDLEDDAASVNMGGDWRMPNRAQCLELFSGTSNGFITSDGTYTQYNWNSESSPLQPDTSVTASTSEFNSTAGHIFFKKSYTAVTDAISAEDYLFIPAAGNCYKGKVLDVGKWGYVWFSSLSTGNVNSAWYFFFASDGAGVDDYYRCLGQSVRGVVTPTRNLITFTINSTSYQAEEGMTWGDWVNSSYNTGGFVLNTRYENTIATDNTFGWLVNTSSGQNVYATTAIVAGHQYRIGATNETE